MADVLVSGVPIERKIFLLWLPGWDKAPPLHKEVAKSWEIQNPDWEVSYVSLSNLGDFLDYDIGYVDHRAKTVTPDGQSDIIRLHLLGKYGGVWADSTVLCMQPLDGWLTDEVLCGNIWMPYRRAGGNQGTKALYSFIAATTESRIIRKMRAGCDRYWESRDAAHHMFWLDGLMNHWITHDPECYDEFARMPKLEADGPMREALTHSLAGQVGGVPRMQLDTPGFKKTLAEKPPYVLKLWWSGEPLPDPNSNAGYALELSKQQNTYIHPFLPKEEEAEIPFVGEREPEGGDGESDG